MESGAKESEDDHFDILHPIFFFSLIIKFSGYSKKAELIKKKLYESTVFSRKTPSYTFNMKIFVKK